MKILAAAKKSLVFIKNRCRSSRWQMFFKKAALKNFVIFTGKHLCWNLFLTKLQVFRCFPVNIATFLRAAFWWNTSSGCFCRCSVLHCLSKKALLIILQLCIAFSFWNLKPLSFTFILCATRCHSFYDSLPFVVTRCHSLLFIVICCHSMSLVVTRCTTRCTSRCHLLSLVVTRCTTPLSLYKRSFFFSHV